MGINTEKMRSLRSCLELLLDLEERKRAAPLGRSASRHHFTALEGCQILLKV